MECLRRTRFKHAIYLDADIFVIASISDIFTVLERFDIAAAHDQDRNGPLATVDFTQNLPAAFPQYNSGVLGVTRNTKTQALLQEWEHLVSSTNAPRDQPILRELLFGSDLKIGTLPAEYNLFDINQLRIWSALDTAPRVLHHYYLHAHIKTDRPQIKSVEALLGKPLSDHIQRLINADKYLFPDNTSAHVPAFCNLHPHKRIPNPFVPS
ncbi:MAG: putative nucleotide-diphospho-sugar transferase [Paracoccaceae bacterium]